MTGFAVGAIAMFLWDPDRGRLRRGRLQERTLGRLRRGGEAVTGRAEDLLNRAQGLVAKATECLETDQPVADDVLEARVRSRLGHVTGHAHSIMTTVRNGVVHVQGTLGPEKRRILAGIWGVPGVQDVEIRPAPEGAA